MEKHPLLQAVTVSVLLCGCTTWTLMKCPMKKQCGNYTRMQHAVRNKSFKQYPFKQQLYHHLPPILQTIQVRWARHGWHYWRSKDELISNFLLWTPTHGHTTVDEPAKICIHQFCVDTGCRLEDLKNVMGRERVKGIHTASTSWWWWWWWWHIKKMEVPMV